MASDFELLRTFISLKTKGLKQVLADFRQVRQEARSLQNVRINTRPSGGRGAQATPGTPEFTENLRKARVEYSDITRSSQRYNEQIASLAGLQRRLQQLRRGATPGSRDEQSIAAFQSQVANRRASLERQQATRALADDRQRRQQELKDARQSFVEVQNYERRKLRERVQAERQAASALQASNRARLQAAREDFLNIRNSERRKLRARVAAERESQRLLKVSNAQRAAAAREDFERIRRFERRKANLRIRAAREAAAAESRASNLVTRAVQVFNSATLEAGFLFPIVRASGNFARLGTNLASVAQAAGATARTTAALAAVLGGAGIAAGGLFTALTGLARLLTGALRAGFNLVFGNIVRFGQLAFQAASNVELLAAATGALAAKLAVNFGTRLEQLGAQFRVAFGGQANRELEFLTQLADRLGVSLEALTENYAKISIAGRRLGITQAETKELFEGISAASRSLGLDTERTNGIFFAFEQIISKGRLSAEELRRQLGDRLPGAFGIAADALGVTSQRLNELLERGEIDAKAFIRVIGPELQRAFSGGAQELSRGIGAEVTRLRNNLLLLGFSFARVVAPAVAEVVRGVNRLVDGLRDSRFFQGVVQRLSIEFRRLGAFLPDFVEFGQQAFRDIAPAVSNLTRLLLELKTAGILGVIEAVRQLAPALNRIVNAVREIASYLTGIRFDNVESGIRGVREQMELMGLAVQRMGLFIRLMVTDFRIAKETVEGFKRGVFQNRLAALFGTIRQSEVLINLKRDREDLEKEIRGIGETLEFLQAFPSRALDNRENQQKIRANLASAFAFAKGKYAEFQRFLAGRGQAAEGLGDTSTSRRSSNSIVSITELRNTIEASISNDKQTQIADATMESARKLEEVRVGINNIASTLQNIRDNTPDAVLGTLRALSVALPGGGF